MSANIDDETPPYWHREIEPANPMDDPQVSISTGPGDGSLSEEDAFHDSWQHTDPDLLPQVQEPSGVNDPDRANVEGDMARAMYRTRFAPPATLFRVDDAGKIGYAKWALKRQSRLHYDIGPDYSGVPRQKTSTRRSEKLGRCDARLQELGVPEHIRNTARRKVLFRNLNNFSRHHDGIDGAILGYALIELGADADEFLNSKWGDRFEDYVAEQDEIGFEIADLADYMFRNYGGSVDE